MSKLLIHQERSIIRSSWKPKRKWTSGKEYIENFSKKLKNKKKKKKKRKRSKKDILKSSLLSSEKENREKVHDTKSSWKITLVGYNIWLMILV